MEKKTAVTETPAELEAVIKRILDVDMKARSITDEAIELKAETERSIFDKKAALREDYLNRARKKIQQIKEVEEETAAAAVSEAEAEHDKLTALLEDKYIKNRDRWVNEIFAAVIKD